MQTGQLPRKVWMYWQQGEQNAPLLVKKCLESWRSLNPGWDVELLDKARVEELVDLSEFEERDDIGLQALSDILRVKLLTQYGGVWADASLFCIKPLDEWLHNYLQDNFFAFACKRRDRVMTTWFLAGTQDSTILSAWTDTIYRYWRNNKFKKQSYWTRQIHHKLMSLRKRHWISNDFWFSSFVTKFLRVYPYPVNMYLFEKTLGTNPELRTEWFNRLALYDEPAEFLQNRLGMNAQLDESSKKFLDESLSPVHKLNWRQDTGEIKRGSNFEYLLKLAKIS